MAEETIEYRGSTLKVQPFSTGWRVYIYRPGSNLAESPIPHTMVFEDRDACIAEVKLIVDNFGIGLFRPLVA